MPDTDDQNQNSESSSEKPRNPEMENVNLNQPGTEPVSSTPEESTPVSPEPKTQATGSVAPGVDQTKPEAVQSEMKKPEPVEPVTQNIVAPAPASPEPNPTMNGTNSGQAPEKSPETKPLNEPVRPPFNTSDTKATPASPAGKKVSQKIGKEKTTGSKRRFLVGCAGGFVLLFILFVVLMVLTISRTGASNPIMQALGLDPGGIKTFLQGVVGFTFGLFSILFLVIAVVGIFRFGSAQKTDKDKRRHNARVSVLSSSALVVLVILWVFLSSYIDRIVIIPESVIAEIVVVEPEDLTNLEAPVEIRFSAASVAQNLQNSGLTIESMNWDLDGNGEFETPVRDAEITRLYNLKGTYNVGLQVKIQGEETFREPYIKIIVIGDALFDATPNSGIPPLEVQFDATSIIPEGNVSSLDWDFDGDGQFDLEGPDNIRPRHTFEQIGTYEVLLRVVDQNNNAERYTRTIEVTASDQPLVSALVETSPGLSGTIPFQVRFDASDSSSQKGNVIKYQWDFGDGSQLQSGQSVTHVFDKTGAYTVRLEVEDDLGNVGETTIEIQAKAVSSEPESVIKSTPSAEVVEDEEPILTGVLPFKVTFDGSDSLDADDDIITYEWDFDGDNVADEEGATAEYTFETAGQFEATLNVTDSEGQSSSTSLSVIVEEPGVQAVIQASPEDGPAPLTVNFDGSGSSTFEGNIVSYVWDFGDGTPQTTTGATVSHKYEAVGSYVVRLKVVTNNDESDTITKTINVREIPLKACFNSSRLSGPTPLTVSFDSGCSTGKIAEVLWQYGDGVQSTSANPTHTFEFPGTYTVNLEVTDDKNNVSSYQETITAE